ncbi:hypothetical protein B296_00040027 [Ensete ventricosum]|uniref:Uncharacterized protein n=1 Tax=Ensete ventricosum TaxID=4639 RepID=A0A426ZRV5_ENSVE|nr:hypothetical protein B296_00040027 [Ensete ventricosum]
MFTESPESYRLRLSLPIDDDSLLLPRPLEFAAALYAGEWSSDNVCMERNGSTFCCTSGEGKNGATLYFWRLWGCLIISTCSTNHRGRIP